MTAFVFFAQMIHNYMEHLERTKHQHAVAAPEPADTGTNTSVRIRWVDTQTQKIYNKLQAQLLRTFLLPGKKPK